MKYHINRRSWKGIIMLIALLFYLQLLSAQNRIKGTVTDQTDGSSLIGVSVLIQGTSSGSATDINGQFTINASHGDVLVISYLGYITQEIEVEDQSDISIEMAADIKQLSELVVTGYTSQSRQSITGAVSSIGADEIASIPVMSLDRALQGRVPGVYIGNEGYAGGNTMVRIRGFGTLNNNDPLFIIDGVQVSGGNLSSLNSIDIESMTVLKDASAAAIYGARASNGVVIVTTKKGNLGTLNIDIAVSNGVNYVPKSRFPGMLTPRQLAENVALSQINSNLLGGNPGEFDHPQYGSGTSVSEATLPDFINPQGASANDPRIAAGYDVNDDNTDGIYQLMRANKEGTDWFDEIIDPGYFQNYNVSVSGGGEYSRFLFGIGYYGEEGVIKHTDFDRYSLKINSEFSIANDKVRIGESLSINYSERSGIFSQNTLVNNNVESIISMTYRIPSIIPVRDEGGNFGGTQGGGLGNAINPVAHLYRSKDDKRRELRNLGSVYVEVEPIEGLVFKSLFGMNYLNRNITDFGSEDPEASESTLFTTFFETNRWKSEWNWSNTLSYELELSDSRLNFLIGKELLESTFRESFGGRNDFINQDVSFRFLNAGQSSLQNGGFGGKNTLSSYFGRVDYSFTDRYYTNFTIRRDGSSKFIKNRWGSFVSLGFGWLISEENFFPSGEIISLFKLRGSWGQMGNQNIPDSNGDLVFFAPDLQNSSYDITGSDVSSQVGIDFSKGGNKDIKWETSVVTDFGFDATLFDSKVDVSFSWFNRKTEDMLLDITPPGTGGFADNAFFNVGNVKNKGAELGLNYNGDFGNLKYSIGGNLSTYSNEITSVGENTSLTFNGNLARDLNQISINRLGDPIGSFFGFIVDGIFQNDSEVDAHADQAGARPGTFRFRDANGDGSINDEDRTIIGNPHPDFTYGINLNLAYKNFELDVLGQGVSGNDLFNFQRYFTDFNNFQGQRGTRTLDAWSTTNTSGKLPLLSDTRPGLESAESSYYIEDGGYFKLRSIRLTYSLPSSMTAKLGLGYLKVFAQGKNILVITDYTGIDPEINLQSFDDNTVEGRNRNRDIGIDRGAAPIPRSLIFGVNLGF